MKRNLIERTSKNDGVTVVDENNQVIVIANCANDIYGDIDILIEVLQEWKEAGWQHIEIPEAEERYYGDGYTTYQQISKRRPATQEETEAWNDYIKKTKEVAQKKEKELYEKLKKKYG